MARVASPGLILLILVAVAAVADAWAESPGGCTVGCRVAWSCTIPEHPLSAGVRLGGLSDLATGAGSDDLVLWTITDRGPNGSTEVDGRKVRTLVAPDFVPALVLVRIDRAGTQEAAATVERVVCLHAARHGSLSGRPRGHDESAPIVHPETRQPVAIDPRGVDTEGIAPLADGTFWIAEEYGPSLLHVSAEGEVLERHVPAGTEVAESGIDERGSLPAEYARRRDNRGFEGLAATADGSKLWAILQSPLQDRRKKLARAAGNVRLLGFDARAGRPAVEHVYRLGNPADPAYLTEGAAPDDGKICAIAPLAADRLLVIEQDDEGLAHLYVAGLEGATDTLAWKPPAGAKAETLEQVIDLAAAGIVPVSKELVADLTDLRTAMAAEVDGGSEPRHGPLKLEGLAVLDARHVAVINDNDFSVNGHESSSRSSRLWVVELDRPLPGP